MANIHQFLKNMLGQSYVHFGVFNRFRPSETLSLAKNYSITHAGRYIVQISTLSQTTAKTFVAVLHHHNQTEIRNRILNFGIRYRAALMECFRFKRAKCLHIIFTFTPILVKSKRITIYCEHTGAHLRHSHILTPKMVLF